MNPLILLALLLSPVVAGAESHYITVPGEGWSLKLDAPALASSKGQSEGRRFKYMGSSATGVTLSLHAEPESATSAGACRDAFWTKSQNNPHLVKSSAKLSESERMAFATHLSEGSFQGKAFKSANGHAYFVQKGLCMDLHVSHYPYAEGSEKVVEDILKSAMVLQ